MACDCPPNLLEYLLRYGSWFRFNASEYAMLPIRTNILPQRTPYANHILIAVTVILFIFQFTMNPYTGQRDFQPWAYKLMLKSNDLHAIQFVGYAFLHGGFWHIFANMFFLYIFGNNVNDKLGHFKYVLFYLAGAAISGLAHYLNSDVPTQLVGASGAVCAVTGAYLVLYPKSLITVLYWLFFIGTVELPALWFILLKLIWYSL
jgi:membrane associated rhomboid family serine protease